MRSSRGGSQTDPTAAAQFVAETGIDLLAVSVGNVHILIRGHQTLDLEHLSKIREKVSIPLVLHGGTGIEESTLRDAVGLGVAKVNYGTIIKQRFLAAVRNSLNSNNENPHHLLGLGAMTICWSPDDLPCGTSYWKKWKSLVRKKGLRQ